jgi:hypothetical protein
LRDELKERLIIESQVGIINTFYSKITKNLFKRIPKTGTSNFNFETSNNYRDQLMDIQLKNAKTLAEAQSIRNRMI